jgi:hypothetical protein
MLGGCHSDQFGRNSSFVETATLVNFGIVSTPSYEPILAMVVLPILRPIFPIGASAAGMD